MSSSNLGYFEQPEVWESAVRSTPAERQRIQETIAAIPADAQTLLDVGCGSGVFLNTLCQSEARKLERLVGCDIAQEALKSVKVEVCRCPVTDMPSEDCEFDMVTCLEVLEHITVDDFDEALSEIARVARKYILVTVPNQELLQQNLVICPQCYCCFSPWYHVRSFDASDMPELFPDFRTLECQPVGPIKENAVYHLALVGANLLCRRPPLPANSICPQCQYRQDKPNLSLGTGEAGAGKTGLAGLAAKVKRLASRKRKKRKWLLAFYERKD